LITSILLVGVTYSQSTDDQNNTIDIDPINKLAPNNKPDLHDSIAVMTAEEVAVTASKKYVKKAKRLLREQAEVGRLTRDILENFRFRFEPYYCRYKTEYRSEGFLGVVRCYGGTFISSLAFIPMNNQEYRHSSGSGYGGSYGDEMIETPENRFTSFKVENIREGTEEENIIMFDVIINQPVTIDGRTEEHLRYTFALNYKNGKMACYIDGDTRHYARYYGYLTSLR